MATKKRVLIIEDEADTRAALREMVERSGYEPAEAAEGLDGLVQAERWRPHVILLDIRMPDPDGYEVCRRLKANPATAAIPVIVVTAVEDDALNRLAYEAGAMACVVKPFRLEALLAIIRTAIAGTTKAKAKRETKPA
jgi:CheY-like chemotaxis protein